MRLTPSPSIYTDIVLTSQPERIITSIGRMGYLSSSIWIRIIYDEMATYEPPPLVLIVTINRGFLCPQVLAETVVVPSTSIFLAVDVPADNSPRRVLQVD
jgi:hypothetical protein